MKRSWFPILIIVGLLGLLATLGGLQYKWLGKISEDERERMQKRVETDAARFAEDFNREIQNAYFNFQTESDIWQKKDWAEFNERFDFWRERTAYPGLIKSFYYWQNVENTPLLTYAAEKREFVETPWTDELRNIQTAATGAKSFQPVQTENYALVMPVQEFRETINRIIVRKENTPPPARINLPIKKSGFLVVALDENTLKNNLLADLTNKYFSGGEFKVAVRRADGQTVFQTDATDKSDAEARLFDLSPDNFIFYSNREAMMRMRAPVERKNRVVARRFETKTFSRVESETITRDTPEKNLNSFKIEVNEDNEKPRTIISRTPNGDEKGVWTLRAQHVAGSLEQFAANTRRQNLAISFGILTLLGLSSVLIFLSAQRAKILARRQIEFVSSVSHEFRTPLAVIYSAGENLADGVAKELGQVSRYGSLIKGEGKKLSAMVEQILEFAGANSGKKKYDLRETNAAEIVENALAECQPLLDEKNFTVEKEIAENLPPIIADKNALGQAIQNLIVNSIKYSNGSQWLKISAKNGGGKIKIAVEDRGIGITAKDLRHIFEPFYRAKAVVDEQIHGNGLGLSLVKQTVEAHGGKIDVESEIGAGSKFTMVFTT